jgi:ABC-type histidine transport system ATPase subunit
MELLDKPVNALDPFLDKVLEILESMKNTYEQGKTSFIVDDYYNVMIALERTKDAKERLAAVIQRQQKGSEEEGSMKAALRIKEKLE